MEHPTYVVQNVDSVPSGDGSKTCGPKPKTPSATSNKALTSVGPTWQQPTCAPDLVKKDPARGPQHKREPAPQDQPPATFPPPMRNSRSRNSSRLMLQPGIPSPRPRELTPRSSVNGKPMDGPVSIDVFNKHVTIFFSELNLVMRQRTKVAHSHASIFVFYFLLINICAQFNFVVYNVYPGRALFRLQ